MGDGSGTEGAPVGRARALWIICWKNRTKIAGYLGVIVGAVQIARAAGGGWQTCLLGASVAAIGHYNDQHQGQA